MGRFGFCLPIQCFSTDTTTAPTADFLAAAPNSFAEAHVDSSLVHDQIPVYNQHVRGDPVLRDVPTAVSVPASAAGTMDPEASSPGGS